MNNVSDQRAPNERRRRRFFLRLLLILFGLLATAVLLELGLRVIGVVARPGDLAGGRSVPKDIHMVILCVGDSHTQGRRAPEGLDYPSQLEILLNLANRESGYLVVNLGRTGNNSSLVLNQTKRYLAAAKRMPDIVIFNAGYNNCWNFEDANILPRDIAAGSARAQIRYLAAKSRVLRFSRITLNRLEQLAASSSGEIFQAQRNSVLNQQDKNEVEFLTEWMLQDLVALDCEVRGHRAKLALLSYWNDVPWVDEAYRRMARRYGTPVIDVRNFGGKKTELSITRPVPLVAPDCHPNKFGYARIAQLVERALYDRGLIPRPPLVPVR